MSWLDRVRNALPFTAKRDTADNLWHKCRQCQQMVFVKEWEDNLNVCPRCDHHDRIGAKERFAQLFDGGVHEPIKAIHEFAFAAQSALTQRRTESGSS